MLKKHLLACGIAAVIPLSASADLYVSPILHLASLDTPHALPQVLLSQADIKSAAMSNSSDAKPDTGSPGLSGSEVPLDMAVGLIAPDDWKTAIDPGLETIAVSWQGSDWKETLARVGKENGFQVYFNDHEKALGISKSLNIAKHLASRSNQIWRLSKNFSVKENLSKWASDAGWEVHWDSKLEYDYAVSHDAVFTGPFYGQGGAVDQLLSSIGSSRQSIAATFYTGNNVVLISESKVHTYK